MGSSLALDQNFLCMLFLLCETFFRKFFQCPQRVPLHFFYFAKEWMLKNLKVPPFTVFSIVRFFKSNNFCLKIRFSQAQHAISEYLRTAVFSMRLLFLICSHRSPSIFTRNETFCEHKALLKVFGTMRLAGDLHQKIFPPFSVF